MENEELVWNFNIQIFAFVFLQRSLLDVLNYELMLQFGAPKLSFCFCFGFAQNSKETSEEPPRGLDGVRKDQNSCWKES